MNIMPAPRLWVLGKFLGMTTTKEDVAESRSDVSPSILFEMLASRRRRRILRYLADADGPVFLDELSAHIADHVEDQHDWTIIAAVLVHWELPKLVDADLVHFDRETHIVEEGPSAAIADHHLALVDDREGQ